jgi:hypothetical protein
LTLTHLIIGNTERCLTGLLYFRYIFPYFHFGIAVQYLVSSEGHSNQSPQKLSSFTVDSEARRAQIGWVEIVSLYLLVENILFLELRPIDQKNINS